MSKAEMRLHVNDPRTPDSQDIAIVGISCRLPGARDHHQFWYNLANGVNSIREIPRERWNVEEYHASDRDAPNRSVSKWCGLVDQVDLFDNRFFNISPREAMVMDPQQRLLLEEAWRCIEDSGIPLSTLQQTTTGVYVGVMTIDYRQNVTAPTVDTESYACLGNFECILANRISYLFDLHGPSLPINGGSGSSLVAIHAAKQALLTGECDFALVGAVNLNLHPWKYISFSKSRMLSPSGQCRTFDAGANGYVPGDGIAVMMLQRVADARRCRNHIYGLIKGSAVNHVGKAASITAPRLSAQRNVLLAAYRDAGINPATISYVEAHGTGTSLGDPIEVEALNQVFREYADGRQFCRIGSLKPNIGHLESAAGLAGMIKVLMMMNHRRVAPTINIQTLNPVINLQATPFRIAQELEDWEPSQGDVLRAGVSSIGFGGVNAHVVLEEYRGESVPSPAYAAFPFGLSAKSAESLAKLKESWRRFVATPAFTEQALADIAATALTGRESLPFRWGGIVCSHAELIQLLGQDEPVKRSGAVPDILALGEIAWSDGASVRDLSANVPLVKQQLDTALAWASAQVGAERLQRLEEEHWLAEDRPLFSFLVSYAYASGLLKAGFSPRQVVGEGAGWWVAMVISGALRFEDAVALLCGEAHLDQLVLRRPSLPLYDPLSDRLLFPCRIDDAYLRAVLQVQTQGLHERLGARLPALYETQPTFRQFLTEWDNVTAVVGVRVTEAAIREAGTVGAASQHSLFWVAVLDSLRRMYEKWDIQSTEACGDALEELLALLEDGLLQKESVATLLSGEAHDQHWQEAAHLANQRAHLLDLRKPYRRLRACNETLPEIVDVADWVRALLSEAGARQKDATEPRLELREVSDEPSRDFLQTLLHLWRHSGAVAWSELYPEGSFTRVSLPTSIFEGKSFWVSAGASAAAPSHRETSTDRVVSWSGSDPLIRDHVIVGRRLAPGAALLHLAADCLNGGSAAGALLLENISLLRPLFFEGESSAEVRAELAEGRFSVRCGDQLLSKGGISPVGASASDVVHNALPVLSDGESGSAAYRLLNRQGYQYGETLQVITRYHTLEHGLYVFELTLPAGVPNSPTALRPELLDGVFQAALVAGYHAGLLPDRDLPYIPYIISRLELSRPLSQRCYVVVETAAMSTKAGFFHVALRVCSPNGDPVLRLENLVMKRAPQEFQGVHTPPPAVVSEAVAPAVSLYKPVWVERVAERSGDSSNKDRVAVVLIGDFELGRCLEREVARTYDRAIYVTPGLAKRMEDGWLEIDPIAADHYGWLLEQVTALAGSAAVDLYDLWTWDMALRGTKDLTAGLHGPLLLLQALARWRRRGAFTLLIATRDSQVVQPGDRGAGFVAGALTGLARTAVMEDARLTVQIVDFASGDASPEDVATVLLRERPASGRFALVGYRGDRRYDASLQRVMEVASPEQLRYRRGGTYVISGGMGGIGQQIAADLARQPGITLVLLGRSELDASRQAELQHLRMTGATVEYRRCDVGNLAEVQAVIASARDRYGPIYGVIHAAGTLADRLIANKDWESAQDVLRTKMNGAWALHEATQNDPLDFFVLFSSVVALLGNVGQCDYAAANSFLDAFVHFRRQNGYPGKSISVNWTLWADGGMGRVPQVKATFEGTVGVISGDQAMPAFRSMLASMPGQYVAVGDPRNFERTLEKSGMGLIRSEEGMPDRQPDAERIQQTLLEILADITKVPLSEMDAETDIREYGLESISLTEYAERLTARFATEVSPPLLFEYPSTKGLARYLAARLPAESFPSGGAGAEPSGATLAAPAAAPAVTRAASAAPASVTGRTGGTQTEEVLLRILSRQLGVPHTELDSETDLRDLGLEAVSLTEFADRINAQLGTELDPALLFQYTNISAIADYLRKNHPERIDSLAAVEAPVVRTAPVGERRSEPVYRQGDIAIIGMSGRFPGSRNVRELWQHLLENRDLITEIPPDRWDWQAHAGDPMGEENRTDCRWGGFLTDIRTFDAEFFKISRHEAELMDPQQRLVLEETWHALEDAGYKPSSLSGTDTGVFLGICNTDYNDLAVERQIRLDAYTSTGTYFSIVPNRVSYLFNFHGPSVAVDTACSGSLVSISQAVQAIRNGDCSLAVAGGVNIICSPRRYFSFSNAGMLCEDGRCKTFDVRANGYVRGEGVGMVVLKPVDQAVRDGDHIYAVIRASVVNHGGYANSLTAPNPNAQASLLVRAYEQAGIEPETVGFIETHGTGTKLGDPIEINGLKKAFDELFERRGSRPPTTSYCALGAVKSNIGHLESAAGVAGLIKVLLCMRHRALPGNLHFREVNPYIRLEGSPFFLLTENTPWPAPYSADRKRLPRRAGVSSFGFGGVGAHVVLEEFVRSGAQLEADAVGPQLFVLSAKSPERLRAYASEMGRFLARMTEKSAAFEPVSLAGVAYALQTGREEMEERLAVVAASLDELMRALKRFSIGEAAPHEVYVGSVRTKLRDAESVAGALRSRNVHRLAQLWTAGAEVDWRRLYEQAPVKVPLPGYPFGGEPYWLPEPLRQKPDTGRLAQATYQVGESAMAYERMAPAPRELPAETKSRQQPHLQWTALLQRDIREMVAQFLKVPVGQILESEPLGTYGFDSFQLKRLAHKLSEVYGVELLPNAFFTGGTIRDLTAYMQDEHAGAVAAYYAARQMQASAAVGVQAPAAPPAPTAKAANPPVAAQPGAREMRPQPTTEREPVAIVGAFGLLPGSDNLVDFWENLITSKELVTEVPRERWDWRKYYGNPADDRSKTNSKWGAFIQDHDTFDAPFFHVSPREAEQMDPQHRKFLEVVWKTIEDAGYNPAGLSGRNIGVFAGVQFQDYRELMGELGAIPAQVMTGTAHAMLTNRVSFMLGLRGPSESIDTACSASLVAVHRAVKAIQYGECEWAIAGGVSLALSPYAMVAAGQMGVLSPDGRCKTFDQSANGYVKGEGAGAILLKPLSRAIADHDQIYAVIRGSAVNHGGKANSLTAPNSEAQAELLLKSWENAGVNPATLTYLEVHGTGTELGDPVEVEGIKKAFAVAFERSGSPMFSAPFCGMGTVKTNIGHLEPASGIAGLLKVILSMKYGQLPGIKHFQKLNPYIVLTNSPLYIVNNNRPWDRLKDEQGHEIPRRASISSFGFGGANANVVLEEYLPTTVSSPRGEPCLVVLSAASSERLNAYAEQLCAFLSRTEPAARAWRLEDLAYSLQVGREAMVERLAVIATTADELKRALTAFCQGQVEAEHQVFRGNAHEGRAGLELLAEELQTGPFIKELVTQGKLRKIAQLWVSGLELDWTQLYGDRLPYRISAPTYPLEKKRYWFDARSQVEATQKAPSPSVEAYSGDDVVLEIVEQEIAVVRMQDRQNRNMTCDRLLEALSARFAQVQQNPAIKAVILTGYDNVFCMGGTQEVLHNVASLKERCSDFTLIFRGLLECPVPVIAAMQGHAVGGGLVFGLFADIVVMAEEGVYSSNFTQYGFTPGVGCTFILKEKLGPSLANEMMFTARLFEGRELKERGASVIFRPQLGVFDEALAIARMLVKKPRTTLQVLKQELAGRMLEQLPRYIESEVRMHEQTFSQIDVEHLISRYFQTVETVPDGADLPAPAPTAPVTPSVAQTPPADTSLASPQPRRLLKPTTAAAPAKQPVEAPAVQPPPKAIDLVRAPKVESTTTGATTVAKVQGMVLEALSNILNINRAEIDVKRPFRELGLDSINGVELIRDLNRGLHLHLETVSLYDYATVASLSQFIMSQLPQGNPNEGASSREAEALALLRRLQANDLDLDEAEQLLEGTL